MLTIEGGEVVFGGEDGEGSEGAFAFLGAALEVVEPCVEGDISEVVDSDQEAALCGGEEGRFEEALVIAAQIDRAEGGTRPTRRIEEDDGEGAFGEFEVLSFGGLAFDGESRKLTHHGDRIFLDESQRVRFFQAVEMGILATDGEIGSGKIDIPDLVRASMSGTDAHRAGISKEVEDALSFCDLLHQAASSAHIEEEERIDPTVAGLHLVSDAEFFASVGGERFGRRGVPSFKILFCARYAVIIDGVLCGKARLVKGADALDLVLSERSNEALDE